MSSRYASCGNWKIKFASSSVDKGWRVWEQRARGNLHRKLIQTFASRWIQVCLHDFVIFSWNLNWGIPSKSLFNLENVSCVLVKFFSSSMEHLPLIITEQVKRTSCWRRKKSDYRNKQKFILFDELQKFPRSHHRMHNFSTHHDSSEISFQPVFQKKNSSSLHIHESTSFSFIPSLIPCFFSGVALFQKRSFQKLDEKELRGRYFLLLEPLD